MRTLAFVITLLVAASSFAQSTDASRGLEETIAALSRSGATWFAWKVPFTGQMYCSTNNAQSYMSDPMILANVVRGELQRIRYADPVCWGEKIPDNVQYLTNVTTESSLAWLHARLHTGDDAKKIVFVIAQHDHPSVAGDLIALARKDPDKEIRRAAIFWLGQKAGVKAAAELQRSVDEDPDDDVKNHAVFAISQLPTERSVPMLINLVKTHKSRGVRKKAMFWLAQTNDPRAIDLIESILMK